MGLALVCASALSAYGPAARAHQASRTYVTVRVAGRDVDVDVRVAREDLAEPLGRTPLLVPTRAQTIAGASRAAEAIASRITIGNGDAPCVRQGAPDASLREGPGDTFELLVHSHFACHRQVDALVLRDELFFDLDPAHQAFVAVHAFGAVRSRVLREQSRTLTEFFEPSLAAQLVDELRLGVEHIFTGYDHVAFLVALLLVAGSLATRRAALRYALSVVTAFTVAHSITLVGAALGVVRLPTRWVESAIALSIAAVALDDLRLKRENARRRALTAFAFGLLHGFGFASVLAELGLPRRGAVASLLAFNLGVELGQLMVLALALPALRIVAKPPVTARSVAAVALVAAGASVLLPLFGAPSKVVLVVAASAAVGLVVLARAGGYDRGVRRGAALVLATLSLVWLYERVSGRVILGGILG